MRSNHCSLNPKHDTSRAEASILKLRAFDAVFSKVVADIAPFSIRDASIWYNEALELLSSWQSLADPKQRCLESVSFDKAGPHAVGWPAAAKSRPAKSKHTLMSRA